MTEIYWVLGGIAAFVALGAMGRRSRVIRIIIALAMLVFGIVFTLGGVLSVMSFGAPVMAGILGALPAGLGWIWLTTEIREAIEAADGRPGLAMPLAVSIAAASVTLVIFALVTSDNNGGAERSEAPKITAPHNDRVVEPFLVPPGTIMDLETSRAVDWSPDRPRGRMLSRSLSEEERSKTLEDQGWEWVNPR